MFLSPAYKKVCSQAATYPPKQNLQLNAAASASLGVLLSRHPHVQDKDTAVLFGAAQIDKKYADFSHNEKETAKQLAILATMSKRLTRKHPDSAASTSEVKLLFQELSHNAIGHSSPALQKRYETILRNRFTTLPDGLGNYGYAFIKPDGSILTPDGEDKGMPLLKEILPFLLDKPPVKIPKEGVPLVVRLQDPYYLAETNKQFTRIFSARFDAEQDESMASPYLAYILDYGKLPDETKYPALKEANALFLKTDLYQIRCPNHPDLEKTLQDRIYRNRLQALAYCLCMKRYLQGESLEVSQLMLPLFIGAGAAGAEYVINHLPLSDALGGVVNWGLLSVLDYADNDAGAQGQASGNTEQRLSDSSGAAKEARLIALAATLKGTVYNGPIGYGLIEPERLPFPEPVAVGVNAASGAVGSFVTSLGLGDASKKTEKHIEDAGMGLWAKGLIPFPDDMPKNNNKELAYVKLLAIRESLMRVRTKAVHPAVLLTPSLGLLFVGPFIAHAMGLPVDQHTLQQIFRSLYFNSASSSENILAVLLAFCKKMQGDSNEERDIRKILGHRGEEPAKLHTKSKFLRFLMKKQPVEPSKRFVDTTDQWLRKAHYCLNGMGNFLPNLAGTASQSVIKGVSSVLPMQTRFNLNEQALQRKEPHIIHENLVSAIKHTLRRRGCNKLEITYKDFQFIFSWNEVLHKLRVDARFSYTDSRNNYYPCVNASFFLNKNGRFYKWNPPGVFIDSESERKKHSIYPEMQTDIYHQLAEVIPNVLDLIMADQAEWDKKQRERVAPIRFIPPSPEEKRLALPKDLVATVWKVLNKTGAPKPSIFIDLSDTKAIQSGEIALSQPGIIEVSTVMTPVIANGETGRKLGEAMLVNYWFHADGHLCGHFMGWAPVSLQSIKAQGGDPDSIYAETTRKMSEKLPQILHELQVASAKQKSWWST